MGNKDKIKFPYPRVFVAEITGSDLRQTKPVALALPKRFNNSINNIPYVDMCKIAEEIKSVFKLKSIIIFFPGDVYDDFMYDDKHIKGISYPKSRLIQLWQQNKIEWGDKTYQEIYEFCLKFWEKKSDDVIDIVGVYDDD